MLSEPLGCLKCSAFQLYSRLVCGGLNEPYMLCLFETNLGFMHSDSNVLRYVILVAVDESFAAVYGYAAGT